MSALENIPSVAQTTRDDGDERLEVQNDPLRQETTWLQAESKRFYELKAELKQTREQLTNGKTLTEFYEEYSEAVRSRREASLAMNAVKIEFYNRIIFEHLATAREACCISREYDRIKIDLLKRKQAHHEATLRAMLKQRGADQNEAELGDDLGDWDDVAKTDQAGGERRKMQLNRGVEKYEKAGDEQQALGTEELGLIDEIADDTDDDDFEILLDLMCQEAQGQD